ncbi:MAG: A/G-specific adenine glycosylase, partial [Patescibacteria group bacterium]|nr:A/G-specific adenine glycosylase [Patescibacteria group bacterium]
DFPRVGLTGQTPSSRTAELADKVRQLTGATIEIGERLHVLRHGVTRYRITLECFAARCLSTAIAPTGTKLKWLRPEELDHYPLSTTGRELARLVR